VASVRLSGASPASRDLILSAAAIKPGEPILGLDLDAVRARIERIGWVAHARVMRLLPDTLAISVDERHLMALWQLGGRRDVVTTDGTVVAGLDPRQYPDLPLVVGDGANGTAAAMITGLKAWPGLRARLWALRRVDDRRWDLILKDGSVVMLPDTDEAGALKRLDRLQSASKILDQGLSRIDLRDGDFVVVRPRAGAPTVASRGV
jgi:cell division protein FtsQ